MHYLEYGGVTCACILLLAVSLFSCTSVPQSDFYETEGIVSIYATSLDSTDNWHEHRMGSLNSRVSSDDGSSMKVLHFPFYLQKPGRYEIWLLSKKSDNTIGYNDDEPIEVRIDIADREGFLQHSSTATIARGDLLHWITPTIDGLIDRANFKESGHYRVSLIIPPGHNMVVHKLQMTNTPENRPAGLGLPETNRANMDPVLEKREQRVALPPSWSFGVLKGGADFMSEKLAGQIDSRLNDYFEGSQYRGLPEIPGLGQSDINGLREHIELSSNPRLITYELPFAFYPSDLSSPELFSNMTDELKVRWLQFQTFNSTMSIFDPDSILQFYPESDKSLLIQQQIADLTALRRALFPYIYSLAHLAGTAGDRPVIGDVNYPTQFRLGEAFLVAPVYEQGIEERFVYLPDGLWYHNSSGMLYEGGQSWLIESPVTEIPLFRRAGSIVPFRDNGSDSDLLSGASHRLTIEIAAGAPGTFRLYEDDGLTTNYQTGAFSTTAFRYFEHEDYATFTIGRMVGGFSGQSAGKELRLVFKYADKPESVIANETVLSEGNGMNQWYFEEQREELIVNWVQPNQIKTDFVIHFR